MSGSNLTDVNVVNSIIWRQDITVPSPTLSGQAPPGEVGELYTYTYRVLNGTAPFTFAVQSGTLPAGVTLNTSTGEISGTPTTVETANFTIRVTDDNSDTSDRTNTVEVTEPAVATVVAASSVVGVISSEPTLTYLATALAADSVIAVKSSSPVISLNAFTLAITSDAAGTFTVEADRFDDAEGVVTNFKISSQDSGGADFTTEEFSLTLNESSTSGDFSVTAARTDGQPDVETQFTITTQDSGGAAIVALNNDFTLALNESDPSGDFAVIATRGDSQQNVQTTFTLSSQDSGNASIVGQVTVSEFYPNAPTGSEWVDITPSGQVPSTWEDSPLGVWPEGVLRDGWNLKFDNSTRDTEIVEITDSVINQSRAARYTYDVNHSAGGGDELFYDAIRADAGSIHHSIYFATWMKLSSNWYGHGSCVNKLLYVRPTSNGQMWGQFCAGGFDTLTPRFVDQITNPPQNQINRPSNQPESTWPIRGQWFLMEMYINLELGQAKLWTMRADQSTPVLHVELTPANWPTYSSISTEVWAEVTISGILGGIGDTNNPEVQTMEIDDTKLLVSPNGVI